MDNYYHLPLLVCTMVNTHSTEVLANAQLPLQMTTPVSSEQTAAKFPCMYAYMALLGKQQSLQAAVTTVTTCMSDIPSLHIPIHVCSFPCSLTGYLVVMANVCKVDEWINCNCYSEAVGFPRQCRKVLPRHSQRMQVLLSQIRLCKSRRARQKALAKAFLS